MGNKIETNETVEEQRRCRRSMSWPIEIFQAVHDMHRRERVWCKITCMKKKYNRKTNSKNNTQKKQRLKITLLMAPHTDTTSKLYGWITRFQLYTNLFCRRHIFFSLSVSLCKIFQHSHTISSAFFAEENFWNQFLWHTLKTT